MTTRWRLAYHEAGHAVVGAALGLAVGRVFIDGADGQEGGAYLGDCPDLASTLAVGVAGSLGAILAGFPARGPSRGDVARMQALRPPVPPAHWRALIVEAQGRAVAILRANWPAVRALARELHRHGALDAARVAAIIGERGDRCRT